MDNILEDMGNKWNELSKSQQVALAQTVGGVRQYTTLMALMNNFDFYKQNQQTALTSEGTVQKQADIYAKSWDAAQKRVRASMEGLYADLINDALFISLTNGFEKVISLVDKFIDGIGGVKGLLFSLGTAATTLFSGSLTKGFYNLGQNLSMAFTPTSVMRQRRSDFLRGAAEQMINPDYGRTQRDDNRINLLNKQLQAEAKMADKADRMTPRELMVNQLMMDRARASRMGYEGALTASDQARDVAGASQQAISIL